LRITFRRYLRDLSVALCISQIHKKHGNETICYSCYIIGQKKLLLKGQRNAKSALLYINYLPTIKDIDSILAKGGEIYKNRNIPISIVNLRLDDYVSIALSFVFKIIKRTKLSNNVYSNEENLKPFGEKESNAYQEALIEVIQDFFINDKFKQQ
jgi:hypothetical protein